MSDIGEHCGGENDKHNIVNFCSFKQSLSKNAFLKEVQARKNQQNQYIRDSKRQVQDFEEAVLSQLDQILKEVNAKIASKKEEFDK